MFIYFNRRFAQDIFQVTQITLIQHLNNGVWALWAGYFSNLQRSEPKNNKNNNIPHL